MTDSINTDNIAVIENAHKEIMRLRDENTALQNRVKELEDALAGMTANRDEWMSDCIRLSCAGADLRDCKGRHHSEIAANKLYEALSVPMPRKV